MKKIKFLGARDGTGGVHSFPAHNKTLTTGKVYEVGRHITARLANVLIEGEMAELVIEDYGLEEIGGEVANPIPGISEPVARDVSLNAEPETIVSDEETESERSGSLADENTEE